ncbi:MAG: hypothetical protein M3N98_13870 [Actinomycetota bacterium]|nr:hypothetical protein [Actinomycetota bacterium]
MAGKRPKRGGRVTPKGGPGGRRGAERLTAAERAGLDEIFARLLTSARRDLPDGTSPFEVEAWASHLWSVWAGQHLDQMDPVAVFAGGLIGFAADQATPDALMVLRALGAVALEPYRSQARRAADRLADAGVAEPSWSEDIGTGAETAVSAWLSYDPVDDDGVSVVVGFDGPSGPHTLGVYIDHNLGGIAKDGFAVPAPVDDVLDRLRQNDELASVQYRQIAVAEAAARWRMALELADLTSHPAVSADLAHLRALLTARLSTMPARGRGPAPGRAEMDSDERDRLLAEFLESDEATGLWDDDIDEDDIETLAVQALSFSLDYVAGTSLRFSPVMVEMFCLDWAPRKIPLGEDGLTLLPDVLAAWIRFVGRRRGIPEASMADAVDAVDGYAAEMLELARDPANWGPAKTIALAVRERGIDITNQGALEDLVAEINRNGGIDVLADSLIERR